MRLSNDAFWGLTLRQLALLDERHKESVKRQDRRAGGVIAMLYNINRDSAKDPEGLDWDDFFTEWKEPPKEQTEDEMFQTMMLLTKRTEGLPA